MKGRNDWIHDQAILNSTNWDQLFCPVSNNFWSLSLALFTKDCHLMPSLTQSYSYRTEYIRAFIEVHHCKKYSTWVLLGISPGISEYCEFTVSFPAKNRKKNNDKAILCILWKHVSVVAWHISAIIVIFWVTQDPYEDVNWQQGQ